MAEHEGERGERLLLSILVNGVSGLVSSFPNWPDGGGRGGRDTESPLPTPPGDLRKYAGEGGGCSSCPVSNHQGHAISAAAWCIIMLSFDSSNWLT